MLESASSRAQRLARRLTQRLTQLLTQRGELSLERPDLATPLFLVCEHGIRFARELRLPATLALGEGLAVALGAGRLPLLLAREEQRLQTLKLQLLTLGNTERQLGALLGERHARRERRRLAKVMRGALEDRAAIGGAPLIDRPATAATHPTASRSRHLVANAHRRARIMPELFVEDPPGGIQKECLPSRGEGEFEPPEHVPQRSARLVPLTRRRKPLEQPTLNVRRTTALFSRDESSAPAKMEGAAEEVSGAVSEPLAPTIGTHTLQLLSQRRLRTTATLLELPRIVETGVRSLLVERALGEVLEGLALLGEGAGARGTRELLRVCATRARVLAERASAAVCTQIELLGRERTAAFTQEAPCAALLVEGAWVVAVALSLVPHVQVVPLDRLCVPPHLAQLLADVRRLHAGALVCWRHVERHAVVALVDAVVLAQMALHVRNVRAGRHRLHAPMLVTRHGRGRNEAGRKEARKC